MRGMVFVALLEGTTDFQCITVERSIKWLNEQETIKLQTSARGMWHGARVKAWPLVAPSCLRLELAL